MQNSVMSLSWLQFLRTISNVADPVGVLRRYINLPMLEEKGKSQETVLHSRSNPSYSS